MAAMKINHIDDPAPSPDFSLMSLEGKQVNLSEFDGKVVLLSFWATW
jgi:peroxiredoxin